MQPEIIILSPKESCGGGDNFRTHFRYDARLSAMCVRAWYRGTSINTIVRFRTHDPIDFIGALNVARDNLKGLIKQIERDPEPNPVLESKEGG